ncbi:MAG: GAF domain-containing protein [Aquificae bacterium]|nr:GAF domain-containing protein [Aquificota bacterium]
MDSNLIIDIVYETSKILASSLDYLKNIEKIIRLVKNYTNLEYISVRIEDKDTQELKVLSHTDIELPHLRYKKGEGITGKVWQYGVPVVIQDISKEESFLNKSLIAKHKNKKVAFLAVPIKVEKEVIGVLSAYKIVKENESFDMYIRLLSLIANMTGQFIKLYLDVKQEKEKLEKEKLVLKRQIEKMLSSSQLEGIIGKSKAVLELSQMIKKIAPTSATVLLTGESGVGKEVFAKALHFHSPRASKPFIKINCAAIPEELLESELFGYEKGAFTGATHTKKGKFELADGGTIFLDEIGDMPLSLQAKILRVLQEKEIERLGSSSPRKIDVRIIAATNKDLEKMVYEGTFREDLYYRLNVISLYIPPLRDRKEDIPLLVYYFLDVFNKEYGKDLTISDALMEKLVEYDWPGNIRQLQNTLERMIILSKDKILTDKDLPIDIKKQVTTQSSPNKKLQLPKTVEEIEKEAITKALEESGYIIKDAAKKLGMTPRQVRYRIDKYSIPLKKGRFR